MSMISTMLLSMCLLSNINRLQAQERYLLSSLPGTREQFVQSEPTVINSFIWLKATPLDEQEYKRKLQQALLVAWISKSPTVTIKLSEKLKPFAKRNSSLLLYFMTGFTRCSLQNNYSKDVLQCNLASIKTAMPVYQKSIAIKKVKEMEKLIVLN